MLTRRTTSETSSYAYSVHDTNAVLERVMEAKLQREKRLQEDDSELGSLPSIFFVRQQSRKDSAARDSRVHKLSLSDRGDLSSYLGSPLGSVPRIVVQDGSSDAVPSQVPSSSLTRSSESEAPLVVTKSSLVAVDQASVDDKAVDEADLPTGSDVEAVVGIGKEAAGSESCKANEDVVSASDEVYTDAESGTLGEGTNTERSEFFTPPTSPPDTSSPTTPERECNGVATPVPLESKINGCVQRKSDPEV